jgi:hypothetical protein
VNFVDWFLAIGWTFLVCCLAFAVWIAWGAVGVGRRW